MSAINISKPEYTSVVATFFLKKQKTLKNKGFYIKLLTTTNQQKIFRNLYSLK